MKKLRVLLADDHAMMREALAMLVNGQPDMEVAAQAANGKEAVRIAADTSPDVAVVDVSMPDMNGIEATKQIAAKAPQVQVLALTRHTESGYVRRLLQAGARGYLVKKSAAEELIKAIRIVAQGGTYIEPGLASALLQRSFHGVRADDGQEREPLSVREEEVLRSIAWGRSNKETAAEFNLSIKTVESYKASACRKLKLRSRADIVRYAVVRGWLSEDAAPE
jgi:DNA-binding NarL/FixJ family response regulator